MNRHLAACVALIGFSLASCASPRIVTVRPPEDAGTNENPFAGEVLYLTQFTIKNTKEALDKKDALRAQFVDYLQTVGGFRSVHDATGGRAESAIPRDALTMKVDLEVLLEDKKFHLLSLYSIYLLCAYTPRSGSTTVVGTASIHDSRGRLLSTKIRTHNEPFRYSLWGWFRTGPIQQAFQMSYEDVFRTLAVPAKIETRPTTQDGISKRELQSLVKEVITETSSFPKDGDIQNKAPISDVDTPGYRSKENPKLFALVIGIEKYAAVPRADFARHDAEAIQQHLLAMGYPARNIIYLLDDQASRANIEKYVESWLPRNVKADSRVIVYFSGHGAPEVRTGVAYLVPWDGDVKFLENTGYPIKRLYKKLNALKAKDVVVILDSCFSGAGGRSLLAKGTRPLVTKLDAGLEAVGRVLVLSATGADEITGTDQSQGHGLLTYYFLKGLNEKRGHMTIHGAHEYLLPRVQDAARRENRDQTPQLMPFDVPATREFYFTD